MALSAGLRFESVASAGLRRSLDWRNLALPWTLGKGLSQAFGLLKREQPDAVLMTGGYAGAPVAFAAALRQLALVLLEPNAVLGLANRFFAGAAGAICLAYPVEPPRPNTVVTGNPVRFSPELPERAPSRKAFGLSSQGPVLLVLAGSQGAHSINAALGRALEAGALGDLQLIWITGNRDLEACKAIVDKSGARAFVASFTDQVAQAYAAADLVLARSGASMLAEIAVAGKPALLVPFPFATGDHQRLNAERFVQAGAARLLADKDLDQDLRLASELTTLMADQGLVARMAAASKRLGRPDAAKDVAGVLERIIKGFKYA